MSDYVGLLRRYPDFSRLWLAQVISLLGDWFNLVALSGLVSEYSGGSGLAISGLLLARFLPPLLVSPFAGVLVDRFDRKRLLVFSDGLRAVIVLLLLLANSPDRLWLVYLLTVFQFMMSALFEPGRSAMLPGLVAPDDLLKANTLSNITWSVMLAVGAVFGGVFAGAFGTAAALVIDAATFALSGLLIVFVRYHKPDAPPAPASAAAVSSGGLVEGLRYLRQHLDTAALLFVKVGLSIGSVDALLIAFATTVFVIGENGTVSLGILYSAFGVGAVLGPILLNRFSDRTVRMLRRLTLVSFIMVVAGWLFLGIAPSLPLAALALMLRAMGGSAAWTYSSTMIQMRVPDDLLGRIFSLDWAAFYLMTTISTITTGSLIDVAGREQVRWVVFIAGFASIAPLLLWLLIVYALERREARILTAESSA